MMQRPVDNRNYSWFSVYQEAMLELQSERLSELVQDAQERISRRLEELAQETEERLQEQRAIADAVQNLRILASTRLPGTGEVA
jgi:hypothetical protein